MKGMNTLKLKALVTSILVVLFLIVLITGIGLHLAPNGRTAKEAGWNFLGFDRFSLERIHTISSFLMSGIVIIHFLLNYKLFISEAKNLLKS